jgi:hypothetical protein
MDNTPIVIFGYNRPSHFERTLNSIFNNKEASDTEAFIFIDGVSNETDELNNQKVISIASRELKFRKTTVHIREENIGCKRNIIDGVSEVFSVHKQAIIIEDDLILGKNFLNYMNNALSFYKQKEDIWHVNGYCHPQIIHNKKNASISRLVQPWGWGTWNDRWEKFIQEKGFEKNIISTLNKKLRDEFNFYDLAPYWESALKLDQLNENSIWDAYWYQTIFLNKGFTVFPQVSHVQNIGFDGSGLHSGKSKMFDSKINTAKTINFPEKLKESKIYKFNTYMFYKKHRLIDYYNFHKSKFSSFSNFLVWLKNKFKG